jgi:ABC-2 type transport system permease protein
MFGFLSNLLRLLRAFPGLNELYKFVPDTLFNKNLTYFMDGSVPFSYQNWVIGLGISVIALLIGAKRFANQNID